ncbi:Negative regulator of genetic competence ClpC/MecB [compost metagenome]
MLNEFVRRVNLKDIEVEITDKVVEHISKVGFDDVYGARPLRRAIQSNIEDLFAEELLDGNIKEHENVIIDFVNDKLVINKK